MQPLRRPQRHEKPAEINRVTHEAEGPIGAKHDAVAALGLGRHAMVAGDVERAAELMELGLPDMRIPIAYTLGFTDPAYFSRVFTRVLGVSPRAFRAQVST